MPTDFTSWPNRRQVAALKAVALQALSRFGMVDAQVSLLNHGFNTTFKVVHSGRKYAMRLNLNSMKDHNGVLAEIEILRFLASKGFPVPNPVAATDRTFVISEPFELLGRAIDVVLMTWLPGSIVADSPTPSKWYSAGALMAQLHEATAAWMPTPPATLPRVDSCLMDAPFRLDTTEHLAITPVIRELSARLVAQVNDIFARLRITEKTQFIHTDMHGSNLMSNRGAISVFDFDDAGIGFRIQDLANATFYIRDEPALEQALFDGYASVTPLPHFSSMDFEALLAARTVLLINDLIQTTNSDDFAIIPEYAKKVQWRLENFFETGRFLLAPKTVS